MCTERSPAVCPDKLRIPASRMHLSGSEHPCEQLHAADAVRAGAYLNSVGADTGSASGGKTISCRAQLRNAPQEHCHACTGREDVQGLSSEACQLMLL